MCSAEGDREAGMTRALVRLIGLIVLLLGMVSTAVLGATYMTSVKVDGVGTPPCEVIADLSMQIDYIATADNGDTIGSLLLEIKNSGGTVVKTGYHNFSPALVSSGGKTSRSYWCCLQAPTAAGSYTLVVTPCSGTNGGGTQGTPTEKALDVINGPTATAASHSAGTIIAGEPYTITATVTSDVCSACFCAGDSHYNHSCAQQLIGTVVFTDESTGIELGTQSIWESAAAYGEETVQLTTTQLLKDPTHAIHTIRATFESDRAWHADSFDEVQVTVLADNESPEITCPDPIVVDADAGGCSASVEFEATATDNVSATVDYDIEGIPITSPHSFWAGTTTVTATAMDPSGNTAICTFTVTVNDSTPPEITCPGDVTIECDESTDPSHTGEATATDTCGGVTVTHSDSDHLCGCNTTGTITRTWTATDGSGNTAECIQTITIQDTTPPTISCPADVTLEYPADTHPSNTGTATGSDACGDVTITSSDSTVDGCGSTYTIYRTWKATDECSLFSECVQTVAVVDTTPPSITCPPDATLECGEDTSPANTGEATGSDACGDVTITHLDLVSDDCGSSQTIARTWTATDECGNSSECVQTITVVDTTPPSITCPPDATLECGEDTSPANTGEATGIDACGGATITYTEGAVQFSDGTQVITRTWTATDECGLFSSCDQTITTVDTTPPTTTILGDNPMTVECGTAYVEPGATADDNCCVSLGDLITDSGGVDTSAVGSYPVTYSILDCTGNATVETRTVNVVDTTPPTVTLIGPSPIEVLQGDVYVEPGATVDDNCCVEPAHLIIDASAVDTSTVGSYPVTYDIADCSGNATQVVRTVNVLDVTSPVIEIRVPADLAVYLLHEVVLADWSVFDASGPLTVSATVEVGMPINTSSGGTRDFTVTAVDPSGNSSTETVTYSVRYQLVIDPDTGVLEFIVVVEGEEPPVPPDAPIVVEHGQPIHIGCGLLDVLGDPVTGLQLTLTIVRVTPGEPLEAYEILYLLGVDYDEETCCYSTELCEEAGIVLDPGLYDLWLGLGDGRNLRQRVLVE